MTDRVFLSYRRSDAAHQATALKILLEQKLPGVSIFVDTASINPMEAWPDRLSTALNESAALIALVGPNWRFGPDRSDRFQDPDDWVLREVEHGLNHKRDGLIPVVFGTTAADAYRDLPAELSEISTIQACELSTGARWQQDVDRLAALISSTLGTEKIETAPRYPKPTELKQRVPRLTEAEFEREKLELEALRGWTFRSTTVNTPDGEIEGATINRSFVFANFKRAFAFMSCVAEQAELRSHHPDWSNVWNRVEVRLRTFDAKHSVTWYDIDMACTMNKIASSIENADAIGWPMRPPPN